MVKPKRSARVDKNTQGNSRPASTESPGMNQVSRSTGSSDQADAKDAANANAKVCGSTGTSSEVATSTIVPVVLHHKDKPEVEISVYALLDDGSDSTFVKDSSLKNLGIEGPQTSLQLNTMYGKTSPENRRFSSPNFRQRNIHRPAKSVFTTLDSFEKGSNTNARDSREMATLGQDQERDTTN